MWIIVIRDRLNVVLVIVFYLEKALEGRDNASSWGNTRRRCALGAELVLESAIELVVSNLFKDSLEGLKSWLVGQSDGLHLKR